MINSIVNGPNSPSNAC